MDSIDAAKMRGLSEREIREKVWRALLTMRPGAVDLYHYEGGAILTVERTTRPDGPFKIDFNGAAEGWETASRAARIVADQMIEAAYPEPHRMYFYVLHAFAAWWTRNE